MGLGEADLGPLGAYETWLYNGRFPGEEITGHVTFEFTADNPGNWFFHCHNLSHMEAGMAHVLRVG